MKVRRRPREVFLSHSDTDRPLASQVAEVLRAHAVPVWYSRTHLRGADDWHREIGEALDRCDWFALLLTRASVRSMWVERELVYALTQQRYRGRIVPIVAGACDESKLSWALGGMQHVDLRRFDAGCRELLSVWGLEFDPDARAARGKRRRR